MDRMKYEIGDIVQYIGDNENVPKGEFKITTSPEMKPFGQYLAQHYLCDHVETGKSWWILATNMGAPRTHAEQILMDMIEAGTASPAVYQVARERGLIHADDK